jgi:hypothetical protein
LQIAVQTPAIAMAGPRTSFLQSTGTNLTSRKPDTGGSSYSAITPPGLHSARDSQSAGVHSTTTLETPDPERARKLQKRLSTDPEGDVDLKKIEEKFKWLHSQNRRDGKGRSATVCNVTVPCIQCIMKPAAGASSKRWSLS